MFDLTGFQISVAIVDYGLGNLFSVRNACHKVGMRSLITSSAAEIAAADAVVLPGVGAYGDAMAALRSRDLVLPLSEFAASGKPFIGICLGMQLMLTESYEFGTHKGLGLLSGSVARFENPKSSTGKILKIPHIGWNQILPKSAVPASEPDTAIAQDDWLESPLRAIAPSTRMYFVHSYYIEPSDPEVVLSRSRYGDYEFCSSLHYRNLIGFQFHPERSGPSGLQVYRNLEAIIAAPLCEPASSRTKAKEL